MGYTQSPASGRECQSMGSCCSTMSMSIPSARCCHMSMEVFLCSLCSQSVFTISREGVQDADRDGLLGANRSNSLAIARICNNADRPIPRLHTRVEIVNTL